MVQQGGRWIILLLMLAAFTARVNANNNARNFSQIYSNVEWLQGVPVVLAVLGIICSSVATAGAPLLLMMLKLAILLVTLPALLQTTEVTNSEPEVPSSQPEPEPTTTMPPRIDTHRSGLQDGISYVIKTILRQAELLTTQLFPSNTELKSAIQKDKVNALFRVAELIFSLVQQQN